MRTVLICKPSFRTQRRLLMNGPKEMTRIDILAPESRHRACGVERDPLIKHDPEYPIDVLRVLGPLARQLQQRMTTEALLIPTADLTLPGESLFDAFKLRDPDSRLHVAHAKVPAELFMNE